MGSNFRCLPLFLSLLFLPHPCFLYVCLPMHVDISWFSNFPYVGLLPQKKKTKTRKEGKETAAPSFFRPLFRFPATARVFPLGPTPTLGVVFLPRSVQPLVPPTMTGPRARGNRSGHNQGPFEITAPFVCSSPQGFSSNPFFRPEGFQFTCPLPLTRATRPSSTH